MTRLAAHGRTWGWNAFETKLNGVLSPGAPTIALKSVQNLEAPGYLVIDPENPDNREYIYYGSIAGSILGDVERNQDGTLDHAKGVEHPGDTVVRAVAMEQMWNDLWAAHVDGLALNATAMSHHIDDTPIRVTSRRL